MGLFTDCVSVMGIFPGNCQVRMTEAFLNIKGIGSCFQEERCVGVTQGVKIEQRHIQFGMGNMIGVLERTGLDEGSVFPGID